MKCCLEEFSKSFLCFYAFKHISQWYEMIWEGIEILTSSLQALPKNHMIFYTKINFFLNVKVCVCVLFLNFYTKPFEPQNFIFGDAVSKLQLLPLLLLMSFLSRNGWCGELKVDHVNQGLIILVSSLWRSNPMLWGHSKMLSSKLGSLVFKTLNYKNL